MDEDYHSAHLFSTLKTRTRCSKKDPIDTQQMTSFSLFCYFKKKIIIKQLANNPQGCLFGFFKYYLGKTNPLDEPS